MMKYDDITALLADIRTFVHYRTTLNTYNLRI